MESSGSRELATTQDDLSARPSMQFIEIVSRYLMQDREEIKKISAMIEKSEKQKEVLISIKFFGTAILGLDEKFHRYEQDRKPHVDIEKIKNVTEKERIAADLRSKLKNAPREHDRKSSELDDTINKLNRQLRLLDNSKVGNESASINDRADNRGKLASLEKKKNIAKKKRNKICCACLPANKSKLQQYENQIEEIQEEIVNLQKDIEEDNQQIKESRREDAKRKELLNKELDSHLSERKHHLSVSLNEKLDIRRLAFEKAEKSANRARKDLKDAEWDALCEMSRAKISDLLFLMAHFLKFRQLVVELHLEQKNILINTPLEERESIDAIVKAIHDFNDLLEEQQSNLEDRFSDFYCNKPSKSGREIYHKYQNLSEKLRNQFTQSSSVDKDVLTMIIDPNTPSENPKVSNHPHTFHSRHRHARKKTDGVSGEDMNALSSSASSSSSVMLTPNPNKQQ